MKLPRRQFLHLAAGAAALPAVSRTAWSQTHPALEAIQKIATDALKPAGGTVPPIGTFSITPGVEFAANSYVHTKLAANAPIDPNSAAYVAELTRQINTYASGVLAVITGESPIYIVGPNQPTCRLKAVSTDPYSAALLQERMLAVPIPDPNNFVVHEAGGDHVALIYQPSTKTCWEFWIMQKTGAKITDSAGNLVDEWGAWWGGRMDNIDTNPGWWDNNFGVAGSGLPLLGGYITVNDLVHRGKIEHPIYLAVNDTRAGQRSLPAQRTDGSMNGPNTLMNGMTFRLLPSVTDADLAGFGPVWQPVLTAVRDYGMIIRDRTLSTSVIYAENPANPAYGGTDPYAPISTNYLDWFTTWSWLPLDKLRVLKTTMQP